MSELTPIWPANREFLEKAASILKNGGIGAMPTETVYGLAGDAFNTFAVSRIFEAKNRPTFNPLIVHISDPADLEKLTSFPLSKLQKLIEAFWPGPLTLVLPKLDSVPDLTTGGRPSVAVRLPAHPVARDLIRLSGGFLAAPSANPFNYISPTTAEHVQSQLSGKIDFILDGGSCKVGVESTVISLTEDRPVLLRHGGLSFEDLKTVLPDLHERTELHGDHGPDSPGQLAVHYSPGTPMKLWKGELLSGKKTGFISWSFIPEDAEVTVLRLSEKGDLREAAARIFEFLHILDKLNLDMIYAEPVPEIGLGKAINDRLRKAAGKG